MAPKKAKKPAARRRAEPKVDAEFDEVPADEISETTPASYIPPPVTQAEEKKLVQAIDAAERDVKAAQELVTAAEQKLSTAIKAISDKLGSGPFIIKGRRVTISSRNDTYFFKGDRQDARTLAG
jgi:hypothetical protein